MAIVKLCVRRRRQLRLADMPEDFPDQIFFRYGSKNPAVYALWVCPPDFVKITRWMDPGDFFDQ